MKKENNRSNTGIYLWKLIVIITAIFAIVLSTECFFLVEKTVKEIMRGTSEEHDTSMSIETQETSTDSSDSENKDEGTPENTDNDNINSNPDDDNNNTEIDKPDDNTNTTTDTSSNTTIEDESTNTSETNTITNTISNTVTNSVNTNTVGNVIGNTTGTNTVNTNTIDTDKVSDETENEEKDNVLEKTSVCKKIHEHQKICYLEQYTEEDRESVFLVIQMIDELPEYETISEKLNSFEESGDDEGYSEYYLKISEQVKHIYSYYIDLQEGEKDLRPYVTNSEKLITLYSICGISDMAIGTEVNVQYYADIKRIDRGEPVENITNNSAYAVGEISANRLPIIDTSAEMNGGNPTLPKNGTGRKVTPVNSLIQTLKSEPSTHLVAYTPQLTEIYKSAKYEIDGATTIDKLNRFDGRDAGYYQLNAIWVLKEGKSPNSIEESDWNIYTKQDIDDKNMYFTDDSFDDSINAIQLTNGSTIRYVCDEMEGEYDNSCIFYDYDISNGVIYDDLNNARSGTTDPEKSEVTSEQQNPENPSNKIWYAYTKQTGINSHKNYTDNTGTYTDSGTKIAFGNSNSGTQLGTLTWRDSNNLFNALNQANLAGVGSGDKKVGTSSYSIATFGLTTGLGSDGKIQYSPGVNAPYLFNNGDAIGKTTYDDRFSLNFARHGDTYVLDKVKDNTRTDPIILKNLSVISNERYFHIWTNDFWPMDYVESWGADGHDLKFGNKSLAPYRRHITDDSNTDIPGSDSIKYGASLPTSDDTLEHNAYFGMQLSLDFYMVDDYVGPLEYYFFGDDDLWVYLDGKLVCDLGGVHTAVGEYTNLWDYVGEADGEMHTLAIYYTERGASGSTCWMHFNLPHPLAEATPDSNRGDLTVEKNVVNVDTNQRFNFIIDLIDENGNPLPRRYNYITNTGRTGLVGTGETFFLADGEEITIKNIPNGSTYSLREVSTSPVREEEIGNLIPLEYFVTSSEGATGTIVAKQKVSATFTNAYNHTFAKVEKVWDDDNNSDGNRPEEGINVTLTAKSKNNGTDCSDYVKSLKPEVQFEVNLNEANEWKYEWQDLPKYKLSTNGSEVTVTDEIIYTIDEEQTEELKENYFVLSKVQRDNTIIITNASYKNIILTKVDTEDETKTLAGAQFKLEKLLKDDDDTDMTVDTTFEPIISEITGNDGKFSFEKLKFGRYKLTEVKTPEGYNTIKKPIVINVKQNTIKVTNPTSLLEQIEEFQTDGKLIIDLGKIGNRKGITLTETGGTGTKIFTIAGLAMIIISLSLLKPKQKISISESAKLRRKKRMSRKDKM